MKKGVHKEVFKFIQSYVKKKTDYILELTILHQKPASPWGETLSSNLPYAFKHAKTWI